MTIHIVHKKGTLFFKMNFLIRNNNDIITEKTTITDEKNDPIKVSAKLEIGRDINSIILYIKAC